MSPALELGWIAIRLRLERALGYWLVCVAGGAFFAGLLHAWPPLLVGDLVGLAVAFTADRFRRITPRDVALHLDRSLPEMEESATLALDTVPVTGLAVLQRRKILSRWDSARVRDTVPHHELRRALLTALPLLLFGALLSLRQPGRRAEPGATPASARAHPLALRTLTADIAPPAYTGLPRRRVSGDDVEAAEGATIIWRAEVEGEVRAAWLRGTAGDSLPLSHEGGARWVATMRAARSQLLRLELRGPGTQRLASADVRLGVKPDRPPAVTVLRPSERTQLAADSLAAIPVEVLATDDYGIDAAELSLTIATGRGEAVRFRRLRLPFTGRERAGATATRLRATLDLPGLGLGPGDELYFTAQVTDRRHPVPNRSRSGTVFLSVSDTAAPPTADFQRMALTMQPEYFRSQRQLIIDTEKLLADSAGLAPALFRERANELGADQGLLRLRYGQFLGEEFEEETGDAGETHEHDDPENATLLGQTVKDKLRVAISAMWQAELHLRTAEPRKALPFEYRALEMIKQVQQDSRVYVQRVGFEPPPIEVEKLRLTGKLEGLAAQRRSVLAAAHDTLPGIRSALRALTAPVGDSVELRARLRGAGDELAGLAEVEPTHLAALRDLRRYLDALEAGTPCTECQGRALRGLYAALPPAPPASAHPRGDPSPVAQRFRQLLGGAQ